MADSFYISIFSLVLISIGKRCQTLKTVFKHISKHFEIRQNYASCCFKSLLGGGDVVKYGHSCFDILLKLDSKQFISLRANTQLQDRWGCHKNMTSEG